MSTELVAEFIVSIIAKVRSLHDCLSRRNVDVVVRNAVSITSIVIGVCKAFKGFDKTEPSLVKKVLLDFALIDLHGEVFEDIAIDELLWCEFVIIVFRESLMSSSFIFHSWVFTLLNVCDLVKLKEFMELTFSIHSIVIVLQSGFRMNDSIIFKVLVLPVS